MMTPNVSWSCVCLYSLFRTISGLTSAQFDDDAHALAVRFIAQGRNAVDFLIAGQVGNGLDDARFIDLIRDFRHDNAVFPLVHRFDSRTGPHLDAAPAGRIGFDDAVAAHDLAPVGEIRPFDFIMISSRLASGLSMSRTPRG